MLSSIEAYILLSKITGTRMWQPVRRKLKNSIRAFAENHNAKHVPEQPSAWNHSLYFSHSEPVSCKPKFRSPHQRLFFIHLALLLIVGDRILSSNCSPPRKVVINSSKWNQIVCVEKWTKRARKYNNNPWKEAVVRFVKVSKLIGKYLNEGSCRNNVHGTQEATEYFNDLKIQTLCP